MFRIASRVTRRATHKVVRKSTRAAVKSLKTQRPKARKPVARKAVISPAGRQMERDHVSERLDAIMAQLNA